MKAQAKQRREEYLQRIPIEGKFGQGKSRYRLNYIRAKRSDTSKAWINSIFLVMNLLVLLAAFLFCLFARLIMASVNVGRRMVSIVMPGLLLGTATPSPYGSVPRCEKWTTDGQFVF